MITGFRTVCPGVIGGSSVEQTRNRKKAGGMQGERERDRHKGGSMGVWAEEDRREKAEEKNI